MSSVSTAVAVAAIVASCLTGRAGGTARPAPRSPDARSVPRTQVKWLINTGNLAARWPPAARASCTTTTAAAAAADGSGGHDNGTVSRCRPPAAVVASPNSISRLQMIHGGNTAVLVMPAGDGAHRCCADGVTSQFSLGSVRLDHGRNNLYPVIRPFPDWRAFADDDDDDDDDDSRSGRESRRPAATAVPDDGDATAAVIDPSTTDRRSDTAPRDHGSVPEDHRAGSRRADRSRKIFNAVDAFLDDRGRILWVLDTGIAGVDACYGNKPPVQKQTSDDADDEDPPPKFLAVDVQTNQIISVVSMSRVWKPGVSCFQYIVAIYADTEFNDEGHGRINDTAGIGVNSTGAASCVDWPLIVVGDAGTNHMLVYLHSKDKFTEIMLPTDEDNEFYDDSDDGSNQYDSEIKRDAGNGESKDIPRPRKRWPTPSIRDILYVVPLYPQIGHSRLLITYHGCQDIYNLRLHPSTEDILYFANITNDDNTTDVTGKTPAPPAPVTGTLTILGRKPCKMVILGTDRRRTDISGADGEEFVGGGTTVYFRLENTNDIWSWNTAAKRKYNGGSVFYIDERDFRLVRLGRTCRVPVAVSAGPVVGASRSNDDNNDKNKQPNTNKTQQVVRQLIWMLETNFIDHFAGTADRMGANAKLQPIEEPLYDGSNNDEMVANPGDIKERPPPLRVQPVTDNQINTAIWSSTRCFQREKIDRMI